MFSYSMSDDEQESGCETVDGSPTSDSSGHDSPFAENSFVEDAHQNIELGTRTELHPSQSLCLSMNLLNPVSSCLP